MTDISLGQQIAAVKREIAMRERVYAKAVAGGRMKRGEADFELSAMRCVLRTLEGLQNVAAEMGLHDV